MRDTKVSPYLHFLANMSVASRCWLMPRARLIRSIIRPRKFAEENFPGDDRECTAKVCGIIFGFSRDNPSRSILEARSKVGLL